MAVVLFVHTRFVTQPYVSPSHPSNSSVVGTGCRYRQDIDSFHHNLRYDMHRSSAQLQSSNLPLGGSQANALQYETITKALNSFGFRSSCRNCCGDDDMVLEENFEVQSNPCRRQDTNDFKYQSLITTDQHNIDDHTT